MSAKPRPPRPQRPIPPGYTTLRKLVEEDEMDDEDLDVPGALDGALGFGGRKELSMLTLHNLLRVLESGLYPSSKQGALEWACMALKTALHGRGDYKGKPNRRIDYLTKEMEKLEQAAREEFRRIRREARVAFEPRPESNSAGRRIPSLDMGGPRNGVTKRPRGRPRKS